MLKGINIIVLLFTLIKGHAQIISTVAGNGSPGYSGDGGPALSAQLSEPVGVSFDKNGNLLIAEASNHIIRKINLVGVISTIAGSGSAGFTGDGGQAILATLNVPSGVCVADSCMLISEQNNHVIRKVINNGVISTFAGTGTLGYTGDAGPCTLATLGTPEAIVIDKNENVFVGEWYNNVVRKIDNQGIITTFAGTGTIGYSGDNGPASMAEFNRIAGLAFDGQGNLYVSDIFNHVVRKIDTGGIIRTIAGTGSPGNSGDGGLATNAQLNGPRGLAIDKYGRLYIACSYSHVIRMVGANGVITTIAGVGSSGYSGDGGMAILAQLNSPAGIVLDTNCCLFVADALNHAIRKITGLVDVPELHVSRFALKISPNPNNGEFTVEVQGKGKELVVEIYNVYGQLVLSREHDMASEQEVKISNLSEGVYLVKVIVDGIQHKTGRIIVTK